VKCSDYLNCRPRGEWERDTGSRISPSGWNWERSFKTCYTYGLRGASLLRILEESPLQSWQETPDFNHNFEWQGWRAEDITHSVDNQSSVIESDGLNSACHSSWSWLRPSPPEVHTRDTIFFVLFTKEMENAIEYAKSYHPSIGQVYGDKTILARILLDRCW